MVLLCHARFLSLIEMKQSNENKPYALLINDIHVGKDNIPEFKENWDDALDVCEEYEIPRIIVGGDLFKSRSAQTLSVLMAARAAILKATEKGLEVILANGNHDKVDQESYLGYCHIFSDYENVTAVNSFLVEDMSKDWRFIVMSYFPENTTFEQEFLHACDYVIDHKHTVLYLHEGINGAISPSSDKELSASLFRDFGKVLVGHYHDRCHIKGTNIYYIGASRQHNYGENEEKGYTVLYTDGSTEFVKNEVNQRYHTLEVNVSQLDQTELSISQLVAQGYKVKLKVNAASDTAKQINKQQLIDMGISKIEVVTETAITESHSQDFDVKYDKAGIKKEYTEFCHQKEIAEVETGLSYLDKIQ